MLSALSEELSLDLRQRLRIVKEANEYRPLVDHTVPSKRYSASSVARPLGAAPSSVKRWPDGFLPVYRMACVMAEWGADAG